ncbi:nickel/cobalt transporter [Rhizobium sp.]|uniref:nickel/cobalt transporter n=1 Tax=Rhizobium sp. TaxID=391 RepID=UPI000E8AF6E5|nr:delayed-early response protein/equilibrative nucleoside transporter [Rhizobium sp.]
MVAGFGLLLFPTLAHAGSPLGIGTAEPSFQMNGPLAPFMLWINIHQEEFYRTLTASLRDMRENTHALWTLIGLSFAYGVFHAAGPGHGKAVISSYMIANELELKRGIVISIISSLLQGFVAIATVGVIFLTLRGSGITLTQATNTMETASFALVVLFGLWLLFKKLHDIWQRQERVPRIEHFEQKCVAVLRPEMRKSKNLEHHADSDFRHDALEVSGGAMAGLFGDASAPVLSGKTGLKFQAQALDHDHTALGDGEVCVDCGRSHLPDPSMVSSEHFNLKEAWSAIMAVGLRPCSGALLVMTFSMLNSLYLGGILSVFAMAAGTAITVSALAIIAVGAKGLAVRISGPGSATAHRVGLAIELGGALFVIVIGSLLLAASLQGYHLSSM